MSRILIIEDEEVIRSALRRLLERSLPRIPVLSYAEIASDATIKSVATVRLDGEN